MAVYQGIDTGTTSIRKITVKSGWSGFETVSSAKPKKKVLLLPSSFITFRQFRFPFQDKKRIREILPGELIDTLLFPLDQVTWDISSIVKDKVNTIITPKKVLKEFVEKYGNSVEVIDAEPCALVRIAAYNGIHNAVIIDFGASKTSIYGLKEGRLEFVRVKMMGGAQIDAAIAAEKGISIAEAEDVKIQEGLNNPHTLAFLDTLFSSVGQLKESEYEQVLITGGGSQIPDLADFLESKLNLPVKFFNLPEGLSPYLDAVAFGAAIYDTIGSDKVNFTEHKEESQTKSYGWYVLFLLPILLYSVTLKMQELQLKNENKQLINAMSEAVRKEIPTITKVVSPLSQAKAELKAKKESYGGSGVSILWALSGVSKAREGMTVNFYDIDFAGGEMKLKGETDSFKTVDQLRQSLEKTFSKVEIVDQQTKPGNKVDFFIKADLSESEPEK